jgi:hypothetical protein
MIVLDYKQYFYYIYKYIMNSYNPILTKEVILINNKYIGKIVSKVLNGKGIIVKLLFDNDYIDKIIVQYNLLPPLQHKGHMLITKDDIITNIDYNSFKRILKEYIKKVNIASTCNKINEMIGGNGFMSQDLSMAQGSYGQQMPQGSYGQQMPQGSYGQQMPQDQPQGSYGQQMPQDQPQGSYGQQIDNSPNSLMFQQGSKVPSQDKLVRYREDSKKYTDFEQFDKSYIRFLEDIFRIEEDVFEKLFPKDLSPNEAIEKKISISETVLDRSALDQLKSVFATALQTYQKPDTEKDFDDYRYRLSMTQFVITDKDFELLGEGIANAIRKRLIKLQRTMLFTDQKTPIYPSINLFSFLIYIKNNNGYCEFKNKYVGLIEKSRISSSNDTYDADKGSRIKSIKEQIIALRFNPNTDPKELKRLEKELRGIKKEDYVFEKVISPSAIPQGNTLVSPYEQLPYESLYSILVNPTASDDIKKQALELLAQDYVICLQPHPSYVIWCFQRLLLAWYSNDKLTKGIHKVCILINFKRAEPGNTVNADYGIMPVILIVPKYGDGSISSRDVAFSILQILNNCFFSYNHVAWTKSYPTYFKSISPLIWYAHGDGVYNAFKQQRKRFNQTVLLPGNADIESSFPKDPIQSMDQNLQQQSMNQNLQQQSMDQNLQQQSMDQNLQQQSMDQNLQQQSMNQNLQQQSMNQNLQQQPIDPRLYTQEGGHYKYYLKKVSSKL